MFQGNFVMWREIAVVVAAVVVIDFVLFVFFFSLVGLFGNCPIVEKIQLQ